jgi:CMP/dCMP kinase
METTQFVIAPMKISITGDLGSGKSRVSRILCSETGFDYLSTGQIQRKLAEELGIDTLEMNRRADTDMSIDQRIDGALIALNDSAKGIVIDSRLAWFFVPSSFKVFLQTELQESVRRIMADQARNSEEYRSPSEAAEKILARKQSENARFLSKYGADCTNHDHFDIIVDTTDRVPEEVAEIILRACMKRQQGQTFRKYRP